MQAMHYLELKHLPLGPDSPSSLSLEEEGDQWTIGRAAWDGCHSFQFQFHLLLLLLPLFGPQKGEKKHAGARSICMYIYAAQVA